MSRSGMPSLDTVAVLPYHFTAISKRQFLFSADHSNIGEASCPIIDLKDSLLSQPNPMFTLILLVAVELCTKLIQVRVCRY